MITLNTIIYEGNFREFLKPDCWFFVFKSIMVTDKLITVNNLTSEDEFNDLISELRKTYDFRVVFVKDEADKVKEIYKLNINESTVGYNYTIPYFVAIEACKTSAFWNVATDCMDDIFVDDEFLWEGCVAVGIDRDCLTIMVAWAKDNHVIGENTVGEYEELEMIKTMSKLPKLLDRFTIRQNFTDQFFLARLDTLKQIDYNIDEKIAERVYQGPEYGGNSFEKRIVSHLVDRKLYNGVYKGPQYYIHDKNYY